LTLQAVLSQAISVLGYAYMARAVTQVEMGVIAGATLLVSLVTMLVDLGLNGSLVKFISENVGRGADFSGYVKSALLLRVLLASAAALQVAAASEALSGILFRTPAYGGVLRIVALDCIPLAIAPLLNSVLWGCGRLRDMAVYSLAANAVRWASIVAFLHSGLGVAGVAYGWLAGDTSLLLMLALAAWPLARPGAGPGRWLGLLPGMLRFSWPLYASSIVSFLYSQYDRVLILAFLPLQQLGVYDVALKAFSVFQTIVGALSSALTPYYGAMYGRGDEGTISEGIRRSSRYLMLAVCPLALGLAATARPVITLFAGEAYEPGWPVLALLSLFGLVNGLSPAFGSLLLIYGRTGTILLVNLASIAVSMVLLPAVALLGLGGLALVKGLSMVASFLISLYFTSRLVAVSIDYEASWKALAASAVMAAAVTIAQWAFYSKLLLPLYVAIGVLVYALAHRALETINSEDLRLIQAVAGTGAASLAAKILAAKKVGEAGGPNPGRP